MTDLLSLVDGPMCECLNADVAHPLRHALSEECRDDANLVLKSDVDPGAPRCIRGPVAQAGELTGGELTGRTNSVSPCGWFVASLPELLVVIRFHALVRVSAISILAPPGKGPDSVRVRRGCISRFTRANSPPAAAAGLC